MPAAQVESIPPPSQSFCVGVMSIKAVVVAVEIEVEVVVDVVVDVEDEVEEGEGGGDEEEEGVDVDVDVEVEGETGEDEVAEHIIQLVRDVPSLSMADK